MPFTTAYALTGLVSLDVIVRWVAPIAVIFRAFSAATGTFGWQQKRSVLQAR
ncbi:MAG TPA: hypothetical protein VG738_21720 [Chitinophagaceae bacterium]|nr:hypothetical protein [Chitinophagaceae bacterium]